MRRLVELRDTMLWILNVDSKLILPHRVVSCSKSYRRNAITSARLCHDKMSKDVTTRLELDKSTVTTSCLRLDPRCDISNEYIVIIRDEKEKILLRLDASSSSRRRNEILRPIVVNGSSVSIEVQKLDTQQDSSSSPWGFACSLWAAVTTISTTETPKIETELETYGTDYDTRRRLDACLVNLVNNLVDRMRSRGLAAYVLSVSPFYIQISILKLISKCKRTVTTRKTRNRRKHNSRKLKMR